MPYLHALSSFRDGVRKHAMGKEDDALRNILALCDKLRDSDLVPLGVALDDQEGASCIRHADSIPRLSAFYETLTCWHASDGRALIKLVPPAELIKARDEKQAQAEAKAAKKAAAVDSERQKRLQKMEKGRIAPEDMFKPPSVVAGTYGSWDVTGLPLTDGEGKELSKNQAKKVQKEWASQKRLHDEFLVWSKEET
jgi:cysteinyl-tRNA synthetase